MPNLMMAGLLLGAFSAVSGAALEHRVRVDHASGATEVNYRGSVQITHKQIGTIAPGGRQSSLRCQWQASVVIDRDARHASGSSMMRTITSDKVIEGSKPGWCSTQRKTIAQEVTRRTDEMQQHVRALAQEDHPVLTAEIERLHGPSRAG